MTLFGLFNSPHVGMELHLHVREGIKDMIFILNSNPTNLNFWTSWLFNKVQYLQVSQLCGEGLVGIYMSIVCLHSTQMTVKRCLLWLIQLRI